MRTLFLCLLAVLPLSSNAADCDGPYTSGWEPWEPYQYQQGDQITGLDIDLVRAVVTNMGCEIAFKEMRWTRLLSEVEKG